MPIRYFQIFLTLLLLFTYGCLLYFILTNQQQLDFSSLYSASQMLAMENNPYQRLYANYLPTINALSFNLNPPALLLLFNPFAKLKYQTTLIIWSVLSLLFGFIGAKITLQLSFSKEFYEKNKLNLYLIYFSFFPVIMDFSILQLGALLFFLLMTGYYFYQKNNNFGASLFWGLLCAIKFFPSLLFLFCLSQKRFRLFWMMAGVFSFFTILPIIFYGWSPYHHYLLLMPRVLWYGDNWNASLFGFLWRVFVDPNYPLPAFFYVRDLYIILSSFLLIWYWKQLTCFNKINTHFSFCFTIVIMLFLSPLGWLYYFSLLSFPLFITWSFYITKTEIRYQVIWFLTFFLINFPMDYFRKKNMIKFISFLFPHSIYFVGLILLGLLLIKLKNITPHLKEVITYREALIVFFSILGFSYFVLTFSNIIRLF